MVTPQILFTASNYVQTRMTDADTGFNGLIGDAATQYGVQSFQLVVNSAPPTLYLGRFTISDLQKAFNVNTLTYPLAILSAARADSIGRQALKVTPSTFGGQVIVSVDFWVSYPTGALPPDGNAMFYAVSDAFIGAMNSEDSFATAMANPGLGYNNEVLVEQGNLTWDGTRWLQFIPCAAYFNVAK